MQKAPPSQGLHVMGGTGLEPVTPSLSIRRRRSHRFALVRLHRMVEPDPRAERTGERTRTNTNPCHPCRAVREPILHLAGCVASARPVGRLIEERSNLRTPRPPAELGGSISASISSASLRWRKSSITFSSALLTTAQTRTPAVYIPSFCAPWRRRHDVRSGTRVVLD